MTLLDTRILQASTPTEEAACIHTLTRAFYSDPAARWIWPDDAMYECAFPGFVRTFGGAAFAQGSAYFIDDHAGAALWLPPGEHPDDEALGALLERTVAAKERPEVLGVFEQMGAFHPSEPHWHLPLIGVRPEHQRRSYGAALMAPVLARCDREGTLAYLEATTPENARLYARLGFERLTEIAAGPTAIAPMVRRPR